MTDKHVVGVRFRHAGKIYYFEPGQTNLRAGDTVIVETVRGVEAAQVVAADRLVPESQLSQPLRTVLRQATPDDLSRLEENREKERDALRICAEKIAEHKLDMHLVGADYTFDRAKLIFYFTSDGRVDFRQLVRDLSAAFKTRIELRQIGVRDEAKMLGGLGSCGRQLCCATFLSEFLPVSIRMAKKQDLSLNPTKISGLCGRLMCCLRYESESYPDAKTAATVPPAAAVAPPEDEPVLNRAEGADGDRDEGVGSWRTPAMDSDPGAATAGGSAVIEDQPAKRASASGADPGGNPGRGRRSGRHGGRRKPRRVSGGRRGGPGPGRG